jgi:16S rRNA (cytosine967-C5)-methyltransferase
MSSSANLRAEAAKLISGVVHQGKSLSEILPESQASLDSDTDRRMVGALVYGALRWYSRMDGLLSAFLERPVPRKQRVLHALMICGLYEQHYLSTPEHAVISETVSAARKLRQPRAAGMVNAILRRSQREGKAVLDNLDKQPAVRHAHPPWLMERLQADWPNSWEKILAANNRQARFWLRVNQQQSSREDYVSALGSESNRRVEIVESVPSALLLEKAMDVERLPG